mgnify:CR=1 FL=1
MFVFGNKKKQEEFIETLSDLGNITKAEAQRYFDNNASFINKSFSRGLDPFSAVAYVAESSMERIDAAHTIGDLSLIEDIPDYLLLVALQAVSIMKNANISSDQLDYNFKYWNRVLALPIDPKKPEFKYDNRLKELVKLYKSSVSYSPPVKSQQVQHKENRNETQSRFRTWLQELREDCWDDGVLTRVTIIVVLAAAISKIIFGEFYS